VKDARQSAPHETPRARPSPARDDRLRIAPGHTGHDTDVAPRGFGNTGPTPTIAHDVSPPDVSDLRFRPDGQHAGGRETCAAPSAGLVTSPESEVENRAERLDEAPSHPTKLSTTHIACRARREGTEGKCRQRRLQQPADDDGSLGSRRKFRPTLLPRHDDTVCLEPDRPAKRGRLTISTRGRDTYRRATSEVSGHDASLRCE
jgi:hypothetical protein